MIFITLIEFHKPKHVGMNKIFSIGVEHHASHPTNDKAIKKKRIATEMKYNPLLISPSIIKMENL